MLAFSFVFCQSVYVFMVCLGVRGLILSCSERQITPQKWTKSVQQRLRYPDYYNKQKPSSVEPFVKLQSDWVLPCEIY